MTTRGPVALLGGGEHRDGCQPIDTWLLERAGRGRGNVLVIPAASTRRTVPGTAALARNHWTALGANVTIALPDGPALTAAVETADLVVLTGGIPDRLIAALGASDAWDRILARWREEGVGLSGSSAGAMALLEWRLRMWAPHPLALAPGLGPLRGHVVAPHFDRFVGDHPVRRRWAARQQARYEGLTVLGVDERTALVGHDGRWEVLGRGAVTLLDGHTFAVHPRGAEVPLAAPLAPAEPARVLLHAV